MTIRDQLLKHMGIVQWKLRDPTVLRGEHAGYITNSTKLVIIADERIDLGNIFIKDILRSMMIDSHQVCCLLTKEISLLPTVLLCPCWILGKELPINSKKWVIHTLPLKKIYFNPQLKRDLWMKICQHENNFQFKNKLI
ncbi:MAG: DNA polymerase III subunit psi [Arsenophonus sp. NC-PE1-MAG3]